MSGYPNRRRRRGLRLGARTRTLRRRLGRALHVARRFTVRTALRIVLYSLVAGVSVAAGLAVVALAGEYGYHPVRNAATWASQPIRYAIGGSCTACHGDKADVLAAQPHAPVSCQACHGPRADHAAAEAGVTLTVVQQPAPDTATCVVCHEQVSGRPPGHSVVTVATHFGGAPCLLCHDPHETTPLAPPRVLHPLDRLPDCLVCHGPEGLRPMPQRHPVWPQGDCLTCHLQPERIAS